MPTQIDNLGFIHNSKRFFPIGFNYWPRDMAVYLWEEYNSNVIEREMKIISELGANCIRMFIRWEDLNSEIGKINESFFSKFDDFITHAKRNDIKLIPTLLIGHMSGQNWFPDWFYVDDESENSNIQYQLIPKPPYGQPKIKCRDFYTDPLVLENSRLQIKEILSRYKDNDTIISYDLSNENQFWMMPKTPEIGTRYMKNMYEFIRGLDKNHPVTYGMGKPDEVSGFISFGPKGLAQYNDYYSVHVYPEWLYPRNPKIFDFYICYRIAFECSLAKICGVPVQLQEFGLSDDFVDHVKDRKERDSLLYGYFNTALWDVILNEIRGGVLTWDFSDFLPKMIDRNPYDHVNYELNFGIVDNEYNAKPSGKAFQRFIHFVNEIDIADFSAPKAKIAVVLPDNFNKFPKKTVRKLVFEDNWKNHSRALFSSFIFLKMCHQNFDFTSLYELEDNLDQYKLLILPNLYNLSEKTEKKILDFLMTGHERLVYLSSNLFVPKEIFGDVKYETQRIKKKSIICSPSIDSLKDIFPQNLEFKAVRYQCFPNFKDENVKPTLKENEMPNNIKMFHRNYDNNNRAVFLSISPEANHSTVRNSYKTETGDILYQSLIKWINLDNEIKCNNPLIEVGMLFNQNKSEALLIAINHDFSNQNCKIELKNSWKVIKEFYNSEFKSIDNKILEFEIKPYDNYIFMLHQ